MAYIYSSDVSSANSYKSLLDSNKLSTSLIYRDYAADSNFSKYDIIIVGSDVIFTGSKDDVILASAIKNSGRSIVALGEGGYSFFGQLKLDIGAPNRWYGNENNIYATNVIETPNRWYGSDNRIYATNVSHPIFYRPNNISIPENHIIQLYNITSCVGIYLPSDYFRSSRAFELGEKSNRDDYYPLALEKEKYFLWGFTDSPDTMTSKGKDLFVNVINYMAGLSKKPNSEIKENETGKINVYTYISWNPDEPVSHENATFTISGPYTYTGKNLNWTILDVPVGTYTINYGSLSGYETPVSETKTLAIGKSITFSDNYLLKKKAGESLDFGDGYILIIKQIDPEKNEVLMQLQLDGRIIDEKKLKENEIYSVDKKSYTVNKSGKPYYDNIFLKDISRDAGINYIYIYSDNIGISCTRCKYSFSPSGLLNVTSIPEGADIMFDGISMGKTPRSIPIDNLKTYSINLKLEGYESLETKYKCDKLGQNNIAVSLNKKLSSP